MIEGEATPRPLTIGIDCRYVQDKFHGVGRYVYGLLTGLCRLEAVDRIILFLDPSLPNQRFSLEAFRQHQHIQLVPITIPLYHPRELWEWPRQIRCHGVNLFHSPYFWSPLLAPCPLVVTVHDMIFDRYPQFMPSRKFQVVYKIMSRLALARATRVIAVSQATASDILSLTRTPPNKVRVVLEGVESHFHPVTDQAIRETIRRRYKLPESYVLALGARRPHKNVGRLIDAYARIYDTVPHALVLVGATDERFAVEEADLLSRLKQAGRIVELGHVEEHDLPAVYSMADLFVQPSIIEGFGLPVLEAMACGCAVACANTSSLPEVAGDAAILFDPFSSDAIAAALQDVLLSPAWRQDLAACGLQRSHRFNWETEAANTLRVYYEAAAEAR